MSLRDKALICLVPFLLAVIIWFALGSQAFSDWQAKDQAVSEKSQEESGMKAKLSNLVKLEKERVKLQADVDNLRNSVPRDPNLDILIIDLEKMCLGSSMDLVGVEKAKAKMVASEEEESKEEEASGGKGENGAKNKAEGPGAEAGEASKKAKGKGPEKSKLTAEEEAGLSKEILQVGVVGSYPNLVELMRKLESYQRIIAISHITIGLPEHTGGKKLTGKPNERLKVTFLLTAYYLP